MLRQLALAASFLLLAPSLVSAQTAKFRIEEASIEDIQAAIVKHELTSTRVVQLYLNRIKTYNGTCVRQPDGVLGVGPITPIKNAHQLNALITVNLRPVGTVKIVALVARFVSIALARFCKVRRRSTRSPSCWALHSAQQFGGGLRRDVALRHREHLVPD